MINKPQLPPRAGYVEKVNDDGVRYYAPTPETYIKIASEEAAKNIQLEMDETMLDQEYRIALLELGGGINET